LCIYIFFNKDNRYRIEDKVLVSMDQVLLKKKMAKDSAAAAMVELGRSYHQHGADQKKV